VVKPGLVSVSATRVYGIREKLNAASSVGLTIEARDDFHNRTREKGGSLDGSSRESVPSVLPEALEVLDCYFEKICGNTSVGKGGYVKLPTLRHGLRDMPCR
jgi:hypothetical protein